MRYPIAILLSLFCLAIGVPVLAGDIIEAEAHASPGSIVVDDPNASGQRAVSHPKAGQPMVSFPTPAGNGRFWVYIGHKGGPLQLKGFKDGKVVELDWIWPLSDQWTWTRVGPYLLEDVGPKLEIFRGKADVAPELDGMKFVLASTLRRKSRLPEPDPSLP
jgi:hypothetical protein